jgi:predicted GIY-YIG superfamily endonuclease
VPFVYILRCADNALYVGETSDLALRLERHQDGTASRFTARRRPVVMIYAEEYRDQQHALARERQLKRWTHAKKEALIVGDWKKLKHLRACDSRHTRRP